MATAIDKWLKWEEVDNKWEDAKGNSPYLNHTGHEHYTWEEVFLVKELGNAGTSPEALEQLSKDKKKKCIKLVMLRKNIKVYDEEKCIDNIQAYAEDIKIIVEELKSQIKVTI